MSDIVERLRACLRFDDQNVFESEVEHVAREAADEIEKLRAECLCLSHAEAEAMAVVLGLEERVAKLTDKAP